MLRLLSIAVLASAAFIVAIPNSPVSAAALTMNNIGPRVGAAPNVAGVGRFAPTAPVISMQVAHQAPKQKKWVCGPIVNYDGSPHCHWVPTPSYP